jgi:hypothetical protein
MRRTTLTAFVVGPPRRPLPLRPSPEPRSINRLVPPPVQRVGFNYPSIGGCDDQPAGKSGTAQPSRRFLLIMSGGNHASLGCRSHSHSRSGGRRLLRIRTGPACAAVALSRTEPGLPSKNRRLGSPPARSPPPGSANLSDGVVALQGRDLSARGHRSRHFRAPSRRRRDAGHSSPRHAGWRSRARAKVGFLLTPRLQKMKAARGS